MFDALRVFFDIDYSNYKKYYVPIEKIILTNEFLKIHPNWRKYKHIRNDFINTGILEPIKINRNYELISGYYSYLILKSYDLGKVPVWFD